MGWTVAVYANGNNELEPEMAGILSVLSRLIIPPDVTVVLQLGRDKRSYVEMLRPHEVLPESRDCWSGVRRYEFDGGPALAADLGGVNMSDPKCLADFLAWAGDRRPGNRLLVILGGHGFLYYGIMADYTGPGPQIMGIRQLGQVLGRVKADLLVLDTCYMNNIETLYELAGTGYVLTWPEPGSPIEGLDLLKFIGVFLNHRNNTLRLLCRELAAAMGMAGLLAVRRRLERIRALSEQICASAEFFPLEVSMLSAGLPWVEVAAQLKREMGKLMIYDPRPGKAMQIALALKPGHLKKLPASYYNLSFAAGGIGRCLLALNGLSLGALPPAADDRQPVPLPREGLLNTIQVMNPGLGRSQGEALMARYAEARGWSWNNPTD